ncbi:MAG: ATP-binding protein, partial [Calditrichaeota bacterium]
MPVNLLRYNRHWEQGFRYPYPKHRALFRQLVSEVETPQIIELSGLRRTGKTTLLFQLINYLLEQRHNPFALWYFTFDEEKLPLEELIYIFSQQTGVDFKKDKIFIFLDEIQKLPNFQNQLKVWYDLYPNLKFFISGSTSLFIKKKTQESLAGRVKSLFLTPLNFTEYLTFREKEPILERPQAFEREIEQEFEMFLSTQFIESMAFPDPYSRREYFVSIIKKIIFEDIPSLFMVGNPEILWQIVRIVAQQPGMIMDYRSLASELEMSAKTLSRYLYFLEEAFLVKKLYNFSRNRITSERKLKRYYLASPSFSRALTDFVDTGRLVENAVVSVKGYQFFWRDPHHHEVDFVAVEPDESIVPIEVKYRRKIQEKDVKNLLRFARKFGCSRAIVLRKGVTQNSL